MHHVNYIVKITNLMPVSQLFNVKLRVVSKRCGIFAQIVYAYEKFYQYILWERKMDDIIIFNL